MIFSRSTLTCGQQVVELANRLGRFPKIGFDTESSGPDLAGKNQLNLYRSDLTGMSIALPGDWPESYYIPTNHKRNNAPLPAVAKLMEALSDYRGINCIHNLKHELYAMKSGPLPWAGFKVTPHCTEVLAWLLNEGAKGKPPKDVSYGLKQLAMHHLGIQMMQFGEVTNGLNFSQLDPRSSEARNYACEDAEVALMLHDKLYPLFSRYKGMEETYLTVEMPLVYVLRHMEDSGMLLDTAQHELLCEDLDKRVGALQEEWEIRWPGLNINSPKQMQYFYDEGHWPTYGVPRKAAGFTTETEVVAKHLAACEEGSEGWHAARLKVAFQELFKLQSSFGRSLIENVSQYPDGRLHGTYLHTGTATGRLACVYPNLMQIPTRTEEGRRIREAFIAEEGWSLCSADYSQIELRVLAHFNGKGMLFEGYQRDADVHRMTAAGIYGIPPEDVTDAQRAVGKTTNFLIVYGGGAEKLATKAKLDGGKDEGKRVLARFRETNPETFETLDRARRAAERKGYVRTLLGRIRKVDIAGRRSKLDALGDRPFGDEQRKLAWGLLGREERRAANTPIQGGARDIITLGMLDFFARMDRSRCKIVGQVHDDLLTEMEDSYVEEGTQLKRECLERAYQLRVPLVAEPKTAKRWSGLK